MTSYKECLVIVCKNRQRRLIEYSFRKSPQIDLSFPLWLHIVPFTKTQELIQKQIPENYSMTATRRLMLQIADKLRERHNALAVFTGESLGQVASQTLESMYAINAVTSTPVLRPLIAIKGRKTGVLVTALMAYMLSSVWLATWPRLSPVKTASALCRSRSLSAICSISLLVAVME